jgi:hypothetical protein
MELEGGGGTAAMELEGGGGTAAMELEGGGGGLLSTRRMSVMSGRLNSGISNTERASSPSSIFFLPM